MTCKGRLIVTFMMLSLSACMLVVDPELLKDDIQVSVERIKSAPVAGEFRRAYCDDFQLPSYRPIPELLIDETRLDDEEYVNETLIDNIGQLRKHIRQERKDLTQAWLDWKEECEKRMEEAGVKIDGE